MQMIVATLGEILGFLPDINLIKTISGSVSTLIPM